MQLSQTTSMRQEMRQLLAPRMIQSMEILQLPLMALEERIEQELQGNPVLELRDGSPDGQPEPGSPVPETEKEQNDEQQALVVKENNDAEDFNRLSRISDY